MILVTGGAGFIGSHLVDALSMEHDVVVVDDLSTGRLENLSDSKDRITFHRMSILDKGIKGVLRDVEVVFHIAAQASVVRSVEDPFFDLEVNVKGLLNILENSNDLERFVFASTGGALYGDEVDPPFDESLEPWPISPYGVSKLACEKYLHSYSVNYGLRSISLRYANVYGARQDPLGEAGVISIFINRLLQGKQPVIFGDGLQTRDYIHVSDVVSANIAALKHNSEGSVFNIGTGLETNVLDLVGVLKRVSGREVVPVHVEARAGEVRRSAISSERAGRVLGWRPVVGLHEGLKRTFEYFEKKRS